MDVQGVHGLYQHTDVVRQRLSLYIALIDTLSGLNLGTLLKGYDALGPGQSATLPSVAQPAQLVSWSGPFGTITTRVGRDSFLCSAVTALGPLLC
jgi:hypothetical protein